MTWNWQQKDWPYFTYDRTALEVLEAQFLYNAGVLYGACKHLNKDYKQQLTIELMSDEALKTSEIEGEYLNRASIQSSLRKHFGLQEDGHPVTPAEQGIATLMVQLYDTFEQLLNDQQLFAWHNELIAGRDDLQDKGKYRTHKETMYIVSGRVHKPTIHFEAPPSQNAPRKMQRFIAWFNGTAPKSGYDHSMLPPLTRAGVAHLYFVSIHPFEDGNGRIGRAIAEKALAQGVGKPTFIGLSREIVKHRKVYYNALEHANKSNEITPWLLYFARTVVEAQATTQSYVEFVIAKAKFYDRFKGMFNERQSKVIERIFREVPSGFKGGLSAEKYISITKATRVTATRDLQNLVAKGALIRTGQRRYTRYNLNIGAKDGALFLNDQ
jgi:Fic family protein